MASKPDFDSADLKAGYLMFLPNPTPLKDTSKYTTSGLKLHMLNDFMVVLDVDETVPDNKTGQSFTICLEAAHRYTQLSIANMKSQTSSRYRTNRDDLLLCLKQQALALN